MGEQSSIKYPTRSSVERIAQAVKIDDEAALLSGIQNVAKAYHEERELMNLPSKTELKREAEKFFGRMNKAISAIRSGDRTALWFRIQMERELLSLSVEGLSALDEGAQVPHLGLDDLLSLLENALDETRQKHEQWEVRYDDRIDEIRAYNATVEHPSEKISLSKPQFPGLLLALKNLESVWMESFADYASHKFSCYVPEYSDKQPNHATRFVVACMKEVDPRIPTENVQSRFKDFSLKRNK